MHPSLNIDESTLARLCREHRIGRLALFGSQLKGTAGQESDVDLLYVLAPGRTLGFAINHLEDELSELFGRPVDLVSKRALHKMLRQGVLAEAQTLYAA